MSLNSVIIFGCMLIFLGLTSCQRKEATQRPLDPSEERLKTLYAQQDAMYGDRYAALEADLDISKGTQKLYWVGRPNTSDPAWIQILHQRFSVRAEFIAGCEFSPRLGNFADAYNSRILEHIAKKYGPNAFHESQQEAIALVSAKQTTVDQL